MCLIVGKRLFLIQLWLKRERFVLFATILNAINEMCFLSSIVPAELSRFASV